MSLIAPKPEPGSLIRRTVIRYVLPVDAGTSGTYANLPSLQNKTGYDITVERIKFIPLTAGGGAYLGLQFPSQQYPEGFQPNVISTARRLPILDWDEDFVQLNWKYDQFLTVYYWNTGPVAVEYEAVLTVALRYPKPKI
jgi:hypothetical protein